MHTTQATVICNIAPHVAVRPVHSILVMLNDPHQRVLIMMYRAIAWTLQPNQNGARKQ